MYIAEWYLLITYTIPDVTFEPKIADEWTRCERERTVTVRAS